MDLTPTEKDEIIQETENISASASKPSPQETSKSMLPSLELKKLQSTPVPPEVTSILSTMQDVFPPKLPLSLPVERETDHRVDLIEGSKPPAHRIYRMSPLEELALKKQLDDYLAAGQIVRTNSPFGAGVLFAAKKDGTLRLCIDYRALNKVEE